MPRSTLIAWGLTRQVGEPLYIEATLLRMSFTATSAHRRISKSRSPMIGVNCSSIITSLIRPSCSRTRSSRSFAFCVWWLGMGGEVRRAFQMRDERQAISGHVETTRRRRA